MYKKEKGKKCECGGNIFKKICDEGLIFWCKKCGEKEYRYKTKEKKCKLEDILLEILQIYNRNEERINKWLK